MGGLGLSDCCTQLLSIELLLGLGGTWDLLWLIAVGLVLQGIGNGTAQPTITATMSNSVDILLRSETRVS